MIPNRSLPSWLACGAILATAGCTPQAPAQPAPASGACTSGPALRAPDLRWKTSDHPRQSIAEVVRVNPRSLQVLREANPAPDVWTRFLSVRVVRRGDHPSKTEPVPPLLGSYRVVGDAIRFQPRFPLEPGVRYRAEFHPSRLAETTRLLDKSATDHPPNPSSPPGKPQTADFSFVEPSAGPATTVTAVYPSRAVLPENLLRFYIHFSAPMSRGEAYRHIRLLDPAGKPVDAPFLELDEELWSGDGRRFTLLFDPGRVKRGLKPREEVGPVLESGRLYELAIDPGWTDADGRPLASGFRKSFRASAADEASPDPKTWTVCPPAPDSRDALEVRFPEPLDRALLDRLIAVRDGSDRPVDGTIAVADEETVWRFTPADPWKPGDYRLMIGTDLEDPSGNSVARPFEVDIVHPITRRITTETVALPFRIGPPSR
ncbi:MAG: Ig-like domain-containing protein [Isosphaeraceae bacterium]